MGQEVVNRDCLPAGRAVCQVGANGVLHLEGTPLLQDQNRHCRELFGQGTQAKFGLSGVQKVAIAIGLAIATAEQNFAIASH